MQWLAIDEHGFTERPRSECAISEMSDEGENSFKRNPRRLAPSRELMKKDRPPSGATIRNCQFVLVKDLESGSSRRSREEPLVFGPSPLKEIDDRIPPCLCQIVMGQQATQ